VTTLTRMLTSALLLGSLSNAALAQGGPRPHPGGAATPTPTQPAPQAPAQGQTQQAQGADKPAATGKVNVQIMVVAATSSATGVDPRLGNLTRYLSNLKYSGYELLDSQQATLSENGDQSFQIEGGRKVTVTLLSRDDAKARMRVQITQGSGRLLDTTLSVSRNGTFIVAGPKYKDGILVLPLTARY